MSGLTAEQILTIKGIMDKLQERAISRMFAIPVDPERDNCPNYLQIVHHPMDIGTVCQKIEENKYNSVAEWKADVELIWSNSLLYNSNNQFLKFITLDMQKTFSELSKFISDNPVRDWFNKLIYLREQFASATKPFEAHASINRLSQRTPVKPKSLSPKPNQKANKAQKPKKKPINRKPLKKSEIVKLTKQINGLTEDSHLISVIEIIEEEEPNVKIEGETLELNLCDVSPNTLILLRNKVESLLPPQPVQ
ncbi:Bromodomain containing protein [Trichomonas vaginalis G3]|uniref:Bromodomain containing protein n=1 Tax=Trichomonas vaginalis (strain ATCC PRA-98 / G3) TaxID=412133 RepID=A2FDZ9_TRIV3|nr:acetylation-dependent protein binding [Trichomonas vaginalis G3]EAX96878.1 Bromodomain containing protein [Trichomonas vaginalis G3]KAI5534795.1 acetylation-dependent protein binding [Trichomonas vaginalis G3]|eukprot:XP_001309808.1 Bromodomain containing protein [Trichomonas vaginalis G3]